MKYFLDDDNDVWAIDQNGNEFLVTKGKLIPAKKGSVDLMWGGCSEEYAKKRMAEIAAV
jgi:hypothetical protein